MCKDCKNNENLHHKDFGKNRRKAIKNLVYGGLALLLPARFIKKAEAGDTRCNLPCLALPWPLQCQGRCKDESLHSGVHHCDYDSSHTWSS